MEALDEFEDALRYSSTPSEQIVSYNQIGDAYRYLEKLDESIAAFRKAKSLGGLPNPVLAMVFGDKGQVEEEIAEYRAVLQVYPDMAVALNNLAYAYSLRGEHLDEALGMAMRAVNAERGNSSYVDTLAWVYFKRGMLEDAEETMVDALQQEGGVHPTLREHLGEVMDARGDWSGERRELRKLMSGELTPSQLVRMKELLRKQ
jgi:tetratricopeptide (TPR) repeat protein